MNAMDIQILALSALVAFFFLMRLTQKSWRVAFLVTLLAPVLLAPVLLLAFACCWLAAHLVAALALPEAWQGGQVVLGLATAKTVLVMSAVSTYFCHRIRHRDRETEGVDRNGTVFQTGAGLLDQFLGD